MLDETGSFLYSVIGDQNSDTDFLVLISPYPTLSMSPFLQPCLPSPVPDRERSEPKRVERGLLECNSDGGTAGMVPFV